MFRRACGSKHQAGWLRVAWRADAGRPGVHRRSAPPRRPVTAVHSCTAGRPRPAASRHAGAAVPVARGGRRRPGAWPDGGAGSPTSDGRGEGWMKNGRGMDAEQAPRSGRMAAAQAIWRVNERAGRSRGKARREARLYQMPRRICMASTPPVSTAVLSASHYGRTRMIASRAHRVVGGGGMTDERLRPLGRLRGHRCEAGIK